KGLLVALSGVLAVSLLFGGCGKKDDAADGSGSADAGGKVTLRLINNKGEVSEQMQELADAYNASQSSVELVVETLGTGIDYQSRVKGYYLADQMPDIIACETTHFARWEGLLADLSGESWLSDTDSAYVDETYGTLGFPYTTEAIGLAYNADILKKAGIDPAKLTSPGAYEEAFAKLDSMKGQLGLTAVVSYSADEDNLWWSAGNHIFGNYLDAGLDRDDTTYIDMLNDKVKFDEKRLANFAHFIGLLNRYSNPSMLTSATQEDEVQGFASGKYAFMAQGSWTGVMMTGDFLKDYEAAGKFKVGMAPYAFEDGIDTILTSTPAWWAVLKEGHVEEAKNFLKWAAGDEGQAILVEKAGFVSPFKSCTYIADDPFAQTIADHLGDGKTSAWHWMDVKPGNSNTPPATHVFYQYASGEINEAGFVPAIEQAFKNYFK
ncbi:MAG: extracellular solute-binding protein, partial [Lachnospiraceae bacterium]|nr:extracellular solute-binding protein [Lachnospiraceae bacterium]